MTERTIVDAAARLRREHEPYLVATVASARGATYRHPGARMLLTRFRWVAGAVSGGCLEGDIASTGWSATRNGEAVLLTYDAGGAHDDDVRSAFGLGCEGVVEVLVERSGLPGRIDALEVAGRCLRGQQRGAVATVFRAADPALRIGTRAALIEGRELEAEQMPDALRDAIARDLADALATGVTTTTTHDGVEVLVEAIVPPPRLFVLGAGHDAVPVATLARHLGWDVVVCAPQAKFSMRDRFAAVADEILVGTTAEILQRIEESARALAIVMSHDHERDRDLLAALLDSRVRYIGMLGPAARTQRMLAALGRAPDPRVHAPVGLTPQEVALAIVTGAQAATAHPAVVVQVPDPAPGPVLSAVG